LLVAVGLLAAVLAASGIVFHYSMDAQRTAGATAEIMRTLRAITDQLNADFAGIQKNAPMIMKFEGANNLRLDSVVFFAVGDFQTTNLYPNDSVRGNVARIYYGEANAPDPNSENPLIRRNKILARKQVILAPSRTDNSNEFEPNSLIQEVEEYLNSPDVVGDRWLRRPDVNSNDVDDIPMYFAKGVDDFSIMVDADVNSTSQSIDWWPKASDMPANMGSGPYPDLIKFTFTLYDSKGIIKNGRRFEHTVYIGN
jgi:hypothetical protein